ncbi:hypothetical protein [Phocaeicola sp.]
MGKDNLELKETLLQVIKEAKHGESGTNRFQIEKSLFLIFHFIIVALFILYFPDISTCGKFENNTSNVIIMSLFFLTVIILVALPFLGRNKVTEEVKENAITNNDAFYKYLHHILNILEDIDKKESSASVPASTPPYNQLTLKDIEDLFTKCITRMAESNKKTEKEEEEKYIRKTIEDMSSKINSIQHLNESKIEIGLDGIIRIINALKNSSDTCEK